MAHLTNVIRYLAASPGTHHEDFIRFLAALPVAVVFIVALLDIIYRAKKWPSVSQRFQDWTGNHPILAAGLAVVLGALLGHFFWWPWKKPWE